MTDSLPDAELDVMQCLWDGQCTATEIRAALSERRPLSHSSVCTLLKRLEDKGLVKRKKAPVGKAFLYEPLIQKQRTHRSMVSEMLDRLFGGNGVDLVASLFETRPPTEGELDELEELLADLRQRRMKGTSKGKSKKGRRS